MDSSITILPMGDISIVLEDSIEEHRVHIKKLGLRKISFEHILQRSLETSSLVNASLAMLSDCIITLPLERRHGLSVLRRGQWARF